MWKNVFFGFGSSEIVLHFPIREATMKITFIGAARHVTGSCTLLNCAGRSVLIDCGMPQGNDEKLMTDLLFRASEIDAVLLTHAHIDHSGWLPLLAKEGFRGSIWLTKATADLCEIMLNDSAHIQEMEAEWRNRKAKRGGGGEVVPIYTVEDAQRAMGFFKTAEYGETIQLSKGISFRFNDAGHMLGSACIEIWMEEGGEKRKLIASGDVGNLDQPLIKDPQPIEGADYVLIESTYGDRLHELPPGAVGHNVPNIVRAKELAGWISRTFARGGNVIIPAFSVGRTQEMLYLMRLIVTNRLCPELGQIPVFVDSPLSVKATGVFAANVEGYYDSEAMELVKKGINPLVFPGLVTITDSADSKALNSREGSCVIISASGMCEAGRIRHHLKHNLWRKECTLVFTGYQAVGTLGRSILDGARHVTLFGEQVDVNCEIRKLEGISGHADRDGLIRWIKNLSTMPRYVFVNHGEEDSALSFASHVGSTLGIKAYAPKQLERFDLLDEASLPKTTHFEVGKLPYQKELDEAIAELDKQQRALNGLLALLRSQAEDQHISAKEAIRMSNTLSRLASDLEFLGMKWGKDA